MIIPDYINGTFELLAGLAVLNHCRILYRDKQSKGVSIYSTIFFSLWGFWNLYYYPFLGQWISFIGGLSIVTANCLWVILLIYYRNKELGKDDGKSSKRL